MSTISATIIDDHRELEQYYKEVINSSDHDHQQRYGNQFTWELARHSIGEELVVYPAFEKYLGAKGHEWAEEDRKEHHVVWTLRYRVKVCTDFSIIDEGAAQEVSEHVCQGQRLRCQTQGVMGPTVAAYQAGGGARLAGFGRGAEGGQWRIRVYGHELWPDEGVRAVKEPPECWRETSIRDGHGVVDGAI